MEADKQKESEFYFKNIDFTDAEKKTISKS